MLRLYAAAILFFAVVSAQIQFQADGDLKAKRVSVATHWQHS